MMFGRRKEPVCVIAGAPCPRTSDPRAKRFCPYWSDAAIVETNDAGEELAVEHCTARISVRAMIQTMKAGHGAAASFDQTRNALAALTGMLGGALKVRGPRDASAHTIEHRE